MGALRRNCPKFFKASARTCGEPIDPATACCGELHPDPSIGELSIGELSIGELRTEAFPPALKQPLDRQPSDHLNRSALPPARPWLRRMPNGLFIGHVLNPFELPAFIQHDFLAAFRNALFEAFRHLGSEQRTVDDEPKLGVQVIRTRIKIKGADEEPRAIHRESLRVKARA